MDLFQALARGDLPPGFQAGLTAAITAAISRGVTRLVSRLFPVRVPVDLTVDEKRGLELWRKRVDRRLLVPNLLVYPAVAGVFYGLLELRKYHEASMPANLGVSTFDSPMGEYIIWGFAAFFLVYYFYVLTSQVLIRLFAGGRGTAGLQLRHQLGPRLQVRLPARSPRHRRRVVADPRGVPGGSAGLVRPNRRRPSCRQPTFEFHRTGVSGRGFRGVDRAARTPPALVRAEGNDRPRAARVPGRGGSWIPSGRGLAAGGGPPPSSSAIDSAN